MFLQNVIVVTEGAFGEFSFEWVIVIHVLRYPATVPEKTFCDELREFSPFTPQS